MASRISRCDLSKISYLCTDIHTKLQMQATGYAVVICRKFLIFAQTITPLLRPFQKPFEVVICRKFLIFAQTITPQRKPIPYKYLLWFVENFLSLHRQSHPVSYFFPISAGCDLSKISYLCTDNHTRTGKSPATPPVVICRKFLIFAQTITPKSRNALPTIPLWFVENFLSLHRQSHLINSYTYTTTSCDLSKISYLCTDNHTKGVIDMYMSDVVICRKFLIFAQTITPCRRGTRHAAKLWFVENFLSLHRQSHQLAKMASIPYRCDLSKISYLCTDNHTVENIERRAAPVVICRKFLIFAQTITPCKRVWQIWIMLWFVENFLSLHRQSHQIFASASWMPCCDLSKISYLCTDNHTASRGIPPFAFVVICRKFLIFAQTITPKGGQRTRILSLWFVENFLSLHRQSHQREDNGRGFFRCDLSKISYLCTDNHTLPEVR